MTDSVGRAYALLGLAPGASPDQVRKRYKALVRKWHPDRFAGDPQGQAEAAVRMRAINDAYHRLVRRTAPLAGEPLAHARPRGQPLTREEIDRMVQALGTEGPVDLFLGWLRAIGRAFLMPLGLIVVAGLYLHLLVTVLRGDWTVLRNDLRMVIYAVVMTIGLIAPYLESRSERGKDSGR